MSCCYHHLKKILSCLFFVLIINNAYSKDLYTWGFAGGTCKVMGEVVKDYGRDGEIAMKSAVRGFLTGYNLSQPKSKMKVINSNSSDYVIAYLKEFCRKEGNDGKIFDALIRHFNALPRAF